MLYNMFLYNVLYFNHIRIYFVLVVEKFLKKQR